MPGAPARLLDLDATVFLAFVESVVRENDDNAKALDRLYAEARPRPKATARTRAERRAEIARFARMTQGETG